MCLQADGVQARTFMAKASIPCARFVPGNASLALLGTAAGDLVVYNASSGREQVGAPVDQGRYPCLPSISCQEASSVALH